MATTRGSWRRRAPLVIAGIAALSGLGVAIWMASESVWQRRITESLEPYRGSPLPARGAPVDAALADVGAQLFRKRCSACHAITGESRAGPDLRGVTARREPSWIRSMILSPDSMTLADPVATRLRADYGIQMLTPRTFDDTHALALIEFLRGVDARAGG